MSDPRTTGTLRTPAPILWRRLWRFVAPHKGKLVAVVKKKLFTLLRCRFTVDVPGPDDLEASIERGMQAPGPGEFHRRGFVVHDPHNRLLALPRVRRNGQHGKFRNGFHGPVNLAADLDAHPGFIRIR